MLCKRSSSYALVPAVEVAIFGSALTSLAGAETNAGASYDEGDSGSFTFLSFDRSRINPFCAFFLFHAH